MIDNLIKNKSVKLRYEKTKPQSFIWSLMNKVGVNIFNIIDENIHYILLYIGSDNNPITTLSNLNYLLERDSKTFLLFKLNKSINIRKSLFSFLPFDLSKLKSRIFINIISLFLHKPFVYLFPSFKFLDSDSPNSKSILKLAEVSNNSPYCARFGKYNVVFRINSLNKSNNIFLKLSTNFNEAKLIKNEKEILESLSFLSLKLGSVPELKKFIEEDNLFLLSLDEKNNIRKPYNKKIKNHHLNFLIELMEESSSIDYLKNSSFIENTSKTKEILKNKYKEAYNIINKALEEAGAKNQKYHIGICHNDFDYKNTFKTNNKKLFVIDWEWSKKDYPMLFDLYNWFLFQSLSGSNESIKDKVDYHFISPGKEAKFVVEYISSLGDYSAEDAFNLLILSVINRINLHVLIHNENFSPSSISDEIEFLSHFLNNDNYQQKFKDSINSYFEN